MALRSSGAALIACCSSRKSWNTVSSSRVTAGETRRPAEVRFFSSFSHFSGVTARKRRRCPPTLITSPSSTGSPTGPALALLIQTPPLEKIS